MAIDKNIVEYAAHLSRIELSPKETEKLSLQFLDILNFIDKLKELNIEGIEPTSHILPVNNVLRTDESKDHLSTDKILMNAPSRRDNFFTVPKVIE
ncbi:MAG: Asp-tRNA(Asn)/Glu-tRNA(Gln) amidotransferase subunit GatC [Candidatus Omnitrophota bacterium]|nr:Asp-tRNA(Asn)/Glu-tRNA(Gln) amidotransferase subunit GatC [Candidatus Omnitrophota bacterium]